MKCPDHGTELVEEPTQFGVRYTCPAYGCTVVCWSGSTSTPANAETRDLRHRCHKAFDLLWQPGGLLHSRTNAYDWLARCLGMTRDQCHFERFQASECRSALAAIANLLDTNARTP